MPKIEDLTEKKFGRLTVIKYYDRVTGGCIRWLCECDCGNSAIVRGSSLRTGRTLSCGCLCRERVRESVTTHGMSTSDIYPEYRNMLSRCYNENAHNYNRYGGRGIKMCDRWKNSIRDFYDDVSTLPHFNERGYTLDRIDNNGDYELSNVRWATKEEQCNNRSSNLCYEYNGEMHTLKEISDMTGMPYKLHHKRIRYLGWDPEKAFTIESRISSKPH